MTVNDRDGYELAKPRLARGRRNPARTHVNGEWGGVTFPCVNADNGDFDPKHLEPLIKGWRKETGIVTFADGSKLREVPGGYEVV
jgi:hypothetical protein